MRNDGRDHQDLLAGQLKPLSGSSDGNGSAGEKAQMSRFAGAAAAEVARIVWGTTRDRRTWAGFCRYGNCDDIIDRAHLCASMFEQGEIKNPITSLQNWLNEAYPETAAYLAYRANRRNGGAR